MTIKAVHDIILFYLDKDQNGFITHEEIDAVLDKAQLALFNDYLYNPKLPIQNQPNRYGQNQRANDSLSPFKVTYTFTTLNTPSGVLTLPADFMQLNTLYSTVYDNALARNVYYPIQVLNEEELIDRLESQVIPISYADPVCIMNAANQIQLFPEQPASGKVYYWRKPATPRFGYTMVGRVITHDPTPYNAISNPDGSIDPEWRDSDVNNIISKALSYYGLNLSSGDVQQFAELKNQQGQ
jgi:hypothetical protein